MNNVEANRVLSVLEDGLEGLKLMSLINKGVLDAAEKLQDVLGDLFTQALIDHRTAIATCGDNVAHVPLKNSTLRLLKLLKGSPNIQLKLQEMQTDPSAAFVAHFSLMEKLRKVTYSKMVTTVEEEESQKTHFEEVLKREEKADKEKHSLEQQLRVERDERSKQMSLVTEMEQRAQEDVESIEQASKQDRDILEREVTETKALDSKHFEQDQTMLNSELQKLKTELIKVEEKNRDSEATLRKKKNKSEQEVSNWLTEYDKDMTSKKDSYEEELAVFNQVKKQMEEYKEHCDELVKEREAYEAVQNEIAQKKAAAAVLLAMENKAALYIQGKWRAHNEKTKASKKKAKKGKKK